MLLPRSITAIPDILTCAGDSTEAVTGMRNFSHGSSDDIMLLRYDGACEAVTDIFPLFAEELLFLTLFFAELHPTRQIEANIIISGIRNRRNIIIYLYKKMSYILLFALSVDHPATALEPSSRNQQLSPAVHP